MSEKHIMIAARMYEARKSLRSILGDRYQKAIAMWVDSLRRGNSKNQPILEYVLPHIKKAQEDYQDSVVLFLLAAAVEIIESDKRANG